MSMLIRVEVEEVTVVVRASGGYAPDVMHDLTNRSRDLLAAACAERFGDRVVEGGTAAGETVPA